MAARLDEALGRTRSGVSDRSGAAIVSRLEPTNRRGDAFEASLRALPGGDQAADGFRRLMDVLGAQTFAPARGSQTASRQEALKAAGGGGMQAAARTVANPFRAVPEWLEDWRRNANTQELAQILTTPEGFHRLRALAQVDDPARRDALVRRLLLVERAQVARSQEGAP